MKPIYVVLIFLQKNDFMSFNCSQKNHIQPCFEMQLFELMPVFFKGSREWPSNLLPKHHTFFHKGYSQGVILSFFSKAIATEVMFVCLFSQKVGSMGLPFAFFSKAQTTYVSPAIKALTAAGKS